MSTTTTKHLTTDDLRAAYLQDGWHGDRCPDSKRWISDARMILLTAALSKWALATLRDTSYVSLGRVESSVDAFFDTHTVERLCPVDKMNFDEDRTDGNVQLIGGGHVHTFDGPRLSTFTTALPGATLYLGRVLPLRLPCVCAYFGEEMVGLLLAIQRLED